MHDLFLFISTHANINASIHTQEHTQWMPQECVIMTERDGFFLNHNFMHNVTDLDAARPDCSPLNPNSTFRLVYF